MSASSSLYVYRLIVSSWPTDDGEPWARYYGEGTAVPNHEIPEWLDRLVTGAVGAHYWNDRSPRGRIAARLKIDDADEVRAVIMPKVSRRHYLSASGAYEVARDMRAFGAVVTVQRSEAVKEWTDVDPAAAGDPRGTDDE